MEIVSVLVAGLVAFGVGAIWYMALSATWIQASGVPVDSGGKPANANNPLTYVTGFVCAIVVAGMMRHVFVLGGIDTIAKGVTSGFGIGAFLATPWLITNYSFAARPRALMLIDGGYTVLGCTAIGLVLTLF